MDLQVHKFGGASVRDGSRIKEVYNILGQLPGKLVLVVSAAGKTTNALEKVVNAYFNKEQNKYEFFEEVKNDHIKIIHELKLNNEHAIADIMDTFIEIEWMIEDDIQDGYDFIYDQIVSIGELVSSKILYYYCLQHGMKVKWLDVRGLIITDNTYREAKVDWKTSCSNITKEIERSLAEVDIIITQGYIGSTSENFSTTLGREGSDFSAGIFSYCLDAESLTIWKDVPGVLNADPSIFENATKIDRLDYREVIEMTYYGAKVIHPKTIKPLQNKGIPLYVRPFSDMNQPGTVITAEVNLVYPPIIVIELDQVLLHISTKDFSFVAEEHLSEIFAIMTELNIKVNMMRNTAISFSACIQNYGDKIERLIARLSDDYTIHKDENLELVTIRHYDGNTKKSLTEGKVILFEETIKDTVRMALKNVDSVIRIK